MMLTGSSQLESVKNPDLEENENEEELTTVLPIDIFDGQYHEVNPGQYNETNPGQYHEANPGQYHEKNPGQYEETDEGKYLEINPGQYEAVVEYNAEDMEEREREEFDLWLEDVRNKYEHLMEKKAARQLRRQQLAKRRTAASQERMRIISQLARNTKKEDTFGMKDEDWDVYKQISKEGGDSDSEEEGLRAAEYEAVLKEHEPQEEEVGKDSPEWHQVHLATEIIRAPELLFQPSMIGSDQAGLSEIIQFVLGKFSEADAEELANNVFLTGGMANLPGLKERLLIDLMEMRPFNSIQNVVLAANPSTDAWSGASAWAATSSGPASLGWMSKHDWEERGEGHLAEHPASNKYFPTPPPRQEVKGEEDDDA